MLIKIKMLGVRYYFYYLRLSLGLRLQTEWYLLKGWLSYKSKSEWDRVYKNE